MVNVLHAYKSSPVPLILNRYSDLYTSSVQMGQVGTVNSGNPFTTHTRTHPNAHPQPVNYPSQMAEPCK